MMWRCVGGDQEEFLKYIASRVIFKSIPVGAVLALVKVVLFGVIVQFSRFSLGNCKNSQ
jgi:hypothetical protein